MGISIRGKAGCFFIATFAFAKVKKETGDKETGDKTIVYVGNNVVDQGICLNYLTTYLLNYQKIIQMNLKLILLLAVGVVAVGVLAWQIVRAWRYRRNHPDEILWPFNNPDGKETE